MPQAVETKCTFVKQGAAAYGLYNVTGRSDNDDSKPDTDVADDVLGLDCRGYEPLAAFQSLKNTCCVCKERASAPSIYQPGSTSASLFTPFSTKLSLTRTHSKYLMHTVLFALLTTHALCAGTLAKPASMDDRSGGFGIHRSRCGSHGLSVLFMKTALYL